MKKIKAVILDLDQTLTIDQASWLQFTQLLGADVNIHLDIFNQFKQGKIGYLEAKGKLINLWRSVNNLDKDSIQSIFEKIELRPGVVDAISYLKSKYNLCIISGAIDIFVDLIADKLGIIDRYASTKFIFDQYNNLSDFKYQLSRGEEKLEFLYKYCDKYQLNPLECAAIGDGDSDIPIFEKVGLAILFIAEETTLENQKKIKSHLRNWQDIKLLL